MDGFYSSFKDIYMSVPEISLPNEVIDNEEVIQRVKNNFKGTDEEFIKIKRGLEKSFYFSGSNTRYSEESGEEKIGINAAETAKNLLNKMNISPNEVDMVIYGSVTRPYLEPSVAAEVASRLGVKNAHVFDVNCACSSLLQAIYTGAVFLNSHKELNYVVCCACEYPMSAVDYNIQSMKELLLKSSAFSLGSASAAVILARKPFKNNGFRLHSFRNRTYTDIWDASITPLVGSIETNSLVIEDAIHEILPEEIYGHVKFLNWKIEDLKQLIFHQPGDFFIRWVINNFPEVNEEKILKVHQYYGYTASTSVLLALDHYIQNNTLDNGDKMLLVVPGAGLSILAAGVSWEG
ncbi:3-oxoacyl-ACP synthase III family protein [Ruminiclostridium cellulolyticum]|uniref:3-Oxoacyl-(Acyl-carrier-protein (ACP)) synthase III domain protein n=1 Tax=Ruminiclostridium cellulolyticum (strain ATCC 35319 / DSM 5812 / JCM 6584 / H10) TaxID=394503 RepID=B8I8L3_RUMCH|nr:3-oxoacyl-[acyl-carrier-protein] synthase III C-terminal domain-containing protein [Ruminiclostridium cellulolyticum]ACL75246.1 3-Oxoacyl-(acyl-carrier-protein (ACP)) synthase III domain protein [Ruminiclostridium cellulolyticum H10]